MSPNSRTDEEILYAQFLKDLKRFDVTHVRVMMRDDSNISTVPIEDVNPRTMIF